MYDAPSSRDQRTELDNKLTSGITVSSIGMDTAGWAELVLFDDYLYALRWINVLEHYTMLTFNEAYLVSLTNSRGYTRGNL